MSLFGSINLISVFLIGLFAATFIAGFLRPPTAGRIYDCFAAVVNTVVFFLAAALAVLATGAVFSDGGDNFLSEAFGAIPGLRDTSTGQDVLAYALVLIIFLTALYALLRLLTLPLLKKAIAPLAAALGRLIRRSGAFLRRVIGGLWQLPRAVGLVLAFSLLLSFYTTLTNNADFADYIGRSRTFRLIENTAIEPIISSEAVRQIPAFLDDTVDQAIEGLSSEGRRLLMKVYINGVTVDEGVASCPAIDNTAIDLVDAETDDVAKARLIYDWIAENIDYDNEKADMLEVDAFAEPAGAVTAFAEGTGVCFDKACLFVSMCRAVGVPVRLITGEAFNGASWESHSWNQIYDDDGGRWINVDATFGKPNVSYFDSDGFGDDHRNAMIQGEWTAR
jgi:hypothetical protein